MELVKQIGIVAAGCLVALLTTKGGEAVIRGVQKKRYWKRANLYEERADLYEQQHVAGQEK